MITGSCHCQTRQKLNRTSYGSTGFVTADSFKIVTGADSLTPKLIEI